MKFIKNIFAVYFSVFMIATSHLSAMDVPPAVKIPAKLSLPVILAGLNNNKRSLEERIRSYNPTAILVGLTTELLHLQRSAAGFDQAVKNSVLTAIFAVHFHGFLTGEIPYHALEPFFVILNNVTGKKDFAGVPGLSGPQKKALLALTKKDQKKMTSLCDVFFLGPQKLFLEPITQAVLGIEREISQRFLKRPARPVFDTNLMQQDEQFLDFAVLFGSSNAGLICGTIGDQFYNATNMAKAKIFYEKAAATRHNTHAMNALGAIFYAEKNTDKAYEYLKAASDKGHAEGMFNLAILLDERGEKEAVLPLLKKSAELGCVNAMNQLAFLLENQGQIDAALKWYRLAASKKHVMAMYNLGMLLEEMGNHKESRQWIEAAARANYPDAQNVFGFYLAAEKNTELAHKYFAEAAKAGVAAALYNLAYINFEKAKKGEIGAQELAYEYVLQAANKDLPEACYEWGKHLLEKGDKDNACLYFQRAARTYSPAVLALALLFTTTKPEEAERHYKEAIKLGVANAEIYYAYFLSLHGRHDEALAYQSFHEAILSPGDLQALEADLVLEKPADNIFPEVKPDPGAGLKAGGDDTPQDNEAFISKRLQKLYDRAEKQEQAPRKVRQPIPKAKPARSYKNIQKFASAKVASEITKENKIKIKSLISALANNDMRGRLKPLKGWNNLYAMRISQKDRFVFEIIEGDFKNGIKAIKIISALGHYKSLDIKAASTAEVHKIWID